MSDLALKYFEKALTNKNCIHKEIKGMLPTVHLKNFLLPVSFLKPKV
jgi:hypothetical protein